MTPEVKCMRSPTRKDIFSFRVISEPIARIMSALAIFSLVIAHMEIDIPKVEIRPMMIDLKISIDRKACALPHYGSRRSIILIFIDQLFLIIQDALVLSVSLVKAHICTIKIHVIDSAQNLQAI